jgi:hypothetical protein
MEISVQRIQRLHVQLVGVAALVALLTRWVSPWSLLVGAGVMGANFWLLSRLVGVALAPSRRTRPALMVGLLVGKFSLFLGMLGLLFWRLPIEPIGFGVGATMLLVACLASALSGRLVPA